MNMEEILDHVDDEIHEIHIVEGIIQNAFVLC